MTLANRIQALIKLGEYLKDLSTPEIKDVKRRAEYENPWFSEAHIDQSLEAIREAYLNVNALAYLVKKYKLDDNIESKKVGLVLAGNIPLVGFHDIICCFITGHISLIKYSEKDTLLTQFLISKLSDFHPDIPKYFIEVNRLTEYDAVIATGSNASAVHFESYFSHVPHIIRKNRNSIAILDGKETSSDLAELGKDVFSYFGLGCRNVSAVLVPENYDVTQLFEGFKDFLPFVYHNKYKNNYDYTLALYLLNKMTFLHNDFMILMESEQIVSRISCIHYQYYRDLDHLKSIISAHDNEIQCIVSRSQIDGIESLAFGSAQCPSIDTYSDGIDTIQFLLSV